MFGWDIEDRLTSATVGANAVSYTYRGDDLRHSKTQAGVNTAYTWDLAAELPVVLQEGNTSYVYGLGLISQTTGTTTSYPLADGLGSTAALTDSSGAVTATYKYDVFGAVKSSTGTGSTEFRFAGQQDDPALGYQYLRARYYDPSTGRFISKDPFPGVFGDPQSQNAYPYVQNNPINFVDPTGAIVWAPILGAAVIGGVVGTVSGTIGAVARGGSVKDVGLAAATGFVSGAAVGAGVALMGATLAPSGISAVAAAAVGVGARVIGAGLAGFNGSAVGQSATGKPVDWALARQAGYLSAFGGTLTSVARVALAGHSAWTVGFVSQIPHMTLTTCVYLGGFG